MQVVVHVAGCHCVFAADVKLFSSSVKRLQTCSRWEYRGLETPRLKSAWLLFCVRAGPSYKSSSGSLIKIDERDWQHESDAPTTRVK